MRELASSLSALCHVSKDARRRWPSVNQEAGLHQTLSVVYQHADLRLSASRTVMNKFRLFKPPRLRYFCSNSPKGLMTNSQRHQNLITSQRFHP